MGCSGYKDTCVLCNDNSANITRLCIQDNIHLLKHQLRFQVFRTISKRYNPYSFLLICEICLMKLQIVTKCDAKVFQSEFYQRMQQSSNSDNKFREHFEDTNCKCEHCVAKYGNLPLLAEVIERIESTKSNKDSKNLQESTQLNNYSDIPINYSVKDNVQTNDCSETIDSATSTKTIDCASAKTIENFVSVPSTSNSVVPPKKRIMACDHCAKVFSHKGDFNKHMRKHTGEQPFECPQCNRKFAHTSNLARHLRVHSGDKPFHCERCDKSFSRKDKLVMHRKTKSCQSAGQSSK